MINIWYCQKMERMSQKILHDEWKFSLDFPMRVAALKDDSSGLNFFDLAVQEKRAGMYDSSLNRYIQLIENTANLSDNVIPSEILRSMTKTLMAANEYCWAYLFLYLIDDKLSAMNPTIGTKSFETMMQARIEANIILDFSTKGNKTKAFEESKAQSGNPYYSNFLSDSEISDQFKSVIMLVQHL